MGNKPVKQEKREEVLLRITPPVDPAFARWLARDIQRVEGYTVKGSRPLTPPDDWIEYMHLQGWLDLDLNDPDLARLFK